MNISPTLLRHFVLFALLVVFFRPIVNVLKVDVDPKIMSIRDSLLDWVIGINVFLLVNMFVY